MDEYGAAPSIPGVPFCAFPLEIQSQIANYLDKKSLFNAILVDKEWFLRLIDLLWRTVFVNTVFTNPAKIITKGRRQYYATKIRRIFIKSKYNASLHEGLEFHSIQHLDVQRLNTADETWLLPLLKTTLQSVNVKAYCDMNTRVLDRLQNCTQLRFLALQGLVQPYNEEKLMVYLLKAPSLREVNLYPGNICYAGYGYLMARMLNALLQRGNLEKISICSKLPKDCFAEHRSTLAQCFPSNTNLLRLHLQAYSPAIVVCLSTATASLYSLDLVLLDSGHNVFKHLRNFPNLSKLTLTFSLESGATAKLSPSHLEILCMLTKLTYLSITTPTWGNVELEWLTDAYFDSWIAHLGCLRGLDLAWSCSLSCAALVSIARSCPLLTCCMLGWRVNLYSLSSLLTTGPLLPLLKSLYLPDVKVIATNSGRLVVGGAAARVIVPTICALFPDLTDLDIDYSGPDIRVELFVSRLETIIRKTLEACRS